MYYCKNCREVFCIPWRSFCPFPDHGGEWVSSCPLCGAPQMYRKERTDEFTADE